MVIEFISLLLTMAAFLFLEGMTGALAFFSYLVKNRFLDWTVLIGIAKDKRTILFLQSANDI
jgi:hypothetical protein